MFLDVQAPKKHWNVFQSFISISKPKMCIVVIYGFIYDNEKDEKHPEHMWVVMRVLFDSCGSLALSYPSLNDQWQAREANRISI